MVDLEKPAYRAATQQMLDAVRLVLVRSESLGRALLEIGCPAGKIRLQRTGIPVEEIPFRERAWPADGAWKFLQAGRLIEKKGLRVSLRAFARFAGEHPARDVHHCRRRTAPERARAGGRRAGHGGESFFSRASFPRSNCANSFTSRTFFCIRATGGGWKPGGRSEFHAGSDGERVAGLRHRARRNSRSDRERPKRNSGAGARRCGLARALLERAANPEGLAAIAANGAEAVRQKFQQSWPNRTSWRIIISKRWRHPRRARTDMKARVHSDAFLVALRHRGSRGARGLGRRVRRERAIQNRPGRDRLHSRRKCRTAPHRH